jgi:hypothetical protein
MLVASRRRLPPTDHKRSEGASTPVSPSARISQDMQPRMHPSTHETPHDDCTGSAPNSRALAPPLITVAYSPSSREQAARSRLAKRTSSSCHTQSSAHCPSPVKQQSRDADPSARTRPLWNDSGGHACAGRHAGHMRGSVPKRKAYELGCGRSRLLRSTIAAATTGSWQLDRSSIKVSQRRASTRLCSFWRHSSLLALTGQESMPLRL